VDTEKLGAHCSNNLCLYIADRFSYRYCDWWCHALVFESSRYQTAICIVAFTAWQTGYYVNFLSDDEGGNRVRAAYGDRYARLVALKNQYAPTNLFRMNQNIKPVP
jgi:hypothetical protein